LSNKLSQWYAKILQHPVWVFVFISLATLYLVSFIPQLRIDASGDSLVLEGDESLAVFRDIGKTYGTSDFLFIAYSPLPSMRPDADEQTVGVLYSKSTREKIHALAQELKAVVGVESVVTYLDVPLLYSPKVTLANFNDGVNYLRDSDIDIALARQEFLHGPVYEQLLTSKDEKTTALQVNIAPADALRDLRNQRDSLQAMPERSPEQELQLTYLNAEYFQAKMQRNQLEKKLVASVRAITEVYKADANIFIGGVPMIVSDMLDFVKDDIVVFGSAIILFIVLALAYVFRAWRWVILPLLTCFYTCAIMLGGVAAFGLHLTVISANFIALLLIITLSITIHIVVRFIEYEKKEADLPQYDLVLKTMAAMVKPCTYTSLTTMVAFLSLVVSGIRPVVDFGWMMTVAVGLALLVGFFVMPAGLLLLGRKDDEREDKPGLQLMRYFASVTERRPKLISSIVAVLIVFSTFGILQLKVENRFIDYFQESTEIFQGMLVIDQQLGGTLPLDIIIDHKMSEKVVVAQSNIDVVPDGEDDFFADAADEFSVDDVGYQLSYWFTTQGMQEIQKIHRYLDGSDESGKVLSLATLYQVMNDVSGGNVDDIQLALIKENAGEDVSKGLIAPYLSADGMQTRISVRVKETSKDLHRSEMIADIKAFLQQEMGYSADQFKVSGMMVLYNNMLQSLYRSQIVTLLAVFVAIMLMFVLLFRSLLLALLAIAPNVLAALFVLGGMGWMNIPLDIMTITIAAITVGIGVDDTIHYIHRFRREYQLDADYVAAMHRSHESIGRAMVYTSVTIIVGFSILTLSNFTPSIYFGVLTGVAMLAALLGASVLLPHLLLICKPFGRAPT
jgi:hypothetical protein